MLSPIYYLADEFSLLTDRCIFLTGKAGTGKTTFLHHLREKTKKQMVVAAPTGVAAINAGGATLHSLFQLPFSPFIPTDESRNKLISNIKMRSDRRKVLYELELLVIDEISMVRADVLDAVDTVLRHFKYNPKDPFGGVQVIFIGDMFQLSPVIQESEWQCISNYYSGPYFFQSKVLEQLNPVYIELDTIFRQQNAQFISILNQVRNNCLTHESLDILNSRYQPDFINSEDDFHITLTTHNHKANKINVSELSKISGEQRQFKAVIQGEFYENNYPVDEVLYLKIGARVMFVRNDEGYPRRFYNGKIGVIKDFDEEVIVVESEGKTIELTTMVWKNIRYTTNDKTKQIEEEEIGWFTQYPLRLAWAITIHKSQGLTLEKAIIDAEQAFTAGQVYVALSRCSSIEGIILLSKINTNTLRNDTVILEHERNKLAVSELEKLLQNAKIEFLETLLSSVFDYRNCIGQTKRLLQLVDGSPQFNEEAVPFLRDLNQQLTEIGVVGDKFKKQLKQLVARPEEQDFLQQRIAAAAVYFGEKIQLLTETILQSPVRSDVKSYAKEYNDSLKNIFGNLTLKTALMNELKHKADITTYFDIKQSFVVPNVKINTYAGDAGAVKELSNYPALLNQLIILRNRICQEQFLPIYIVGSTNMLVDITNQLPRTEKELLRIKGFGKAKFARFGNDFLRLINNFIVQNNLQLEQLETMVEPEKERKPKKQKGDSGRISLNLYKQGKSIAQIAEERNLTIGTIANHLYAFVSSKELPLTDFLSDEKRLQALEIIQDADESVSRYSLLKDILTAEEIVMFLGWMREIKTP